MLYSFLIRYLGKKSVKDGLRTKNRSHLYLKRCLALTLVFRLICWHYTLKLVLSTTVVVNGGYNIKYRSPFTHLLRSPNRF